VRVNNVLKWKNLTQCTVLEYIPVIVSYKTFIIRIETYRSEKIPQSINFLFKCFRFLEEKEERITLLENQMTELGQEAGDREQLLENIQSDKTALSRALTQNKELKNQLAELQNGFVKLVGTIVSFL